MKSKCTIQLTKNELNSVLRGLETREINDTCRNCIDKFVGVFNKSFVPKVRTVHKKSAK